MPRSGQDARRRLQEAALQLFQEQGYEQTTAAQIAARAEVTERTFFRHFTDKREVFFDGEVLLRDAMAKAISEAPEHLRPLQVVEHAFLAVEQILVDNRALAESRHPVIAATPALYERQLAKTASLTEALAAALRDRGVEPALATLAAQAGMAAFSHAIPAWWNDPSSRLGAHLTRALQQLHGLTSGASGTGEHVEGVRPAGLGPGL